VLGEVKYFHSMHLFGCHVTACRAARYLVDTVHLIARFTNEQVRSCES
jgi:hypothetical protein